MARIGVLGQKYTPVGIEMEIETAVSATRSCPTFALIAAK